MYGPAGISLQGAEAAAKPDPARMRPQVRTQAREHSPKALTPRPTKSLTLKTLTHHEEVLKPSTQS